MYAVTSLAIIERTQVLHPVPFSSLSPVTSADRLQGPRTNPDPTVLTDENTHPGREVVEVTLTGLDEVGRYLDKSPVQQLAVLK